MTRELVRVLVCGALVGLACTPKPPAPTVVARGPTSLGQVDTTVAAEDSTSARFYVYEPGRLRDPFLRPGTRVAAGPAGPAEPTPPPLVIQGIILGERPRAMINGRSVGVGDVIDGARIVRINPNSVEIEFAGKRHTITYH